MRLTEQHVSDAILMALIDFAEEDLKDEKTAVRCARLDAFLELKQRRAEDRQREAKK